MKKRITIILMGVLAIMAMVGCGTQTQKYKVNADFGYELDKEMYAPGDEVTAVFSNMYIGTDTDYNFYCENDDVKIKTDYDSKKGYIITFTMPAHDVKLSVSSRNSMEIDYNINNQPDGEVMEGFTGMAPIDPDAWTCPECNYSNNTGGFCSNCGRKKPE